MGDGNVYDSDPKEHKDFSYLICLYLINEGARGGVVV
jgi:hypothetical protein